MDSRNLEISLDKLPIKRLESIDENGVERFPTDVDYEEKRVSLIRRIDFAWAVKKEEEEKNQGNKTKKKKQKKGSKDGSSSATTPWQWQSMVENLQLAHQELSVIIDLINTVEANDAVGVASMTRPKPLPNEILADLAVSTATKLQCYRHLGKYFKQSAKALEQQVAREARFYGALIRLQKNWKVKRQRPAATAPGNEGFTFDLFDSSLYDSAAVCRPSSLSTIRIDRDSTGVLSVNLPSNSCRSLHFGFLGLYSNGVPKKPSKLDRLVKHPLKEEDESSSGNASLKDTHLLLRDVHQAIFDEQVFEMVNREAFNQSLGFNVTGIQENRLQLSINPTTSILISLQQSSQDDQKANDGSIQNIKSKPLPLDSLEEAGSTEGKHESLLKNLDIPISIAYEIYLRQIFHEHIFLKAKERPLSSGPRASTQAGKDGSSLISHFCMSLSHRIFAKEVVMLLEEVVLRVPYLHLIYHPTWHSRTSSWTVFMQVPKSILHSNSQIMKSDAENRKNFVRSEFRTKVVVNDVCISVEAESAPNVVGLFKSCSGGVCSMHKYECELDDLSVIILQQVASQIIQWLYEEAVTVGMKANRDFLCLSIELEQGEILSLVAHVDPEDSQGCIYWWLVMEDSFAEERRPYMDITDGASEYRKFLGYLPVDVLYSVLMDLVSLCSGGGNH